jgi:hypothetical protein
MASKGDKASAGLNTGAAAAGAVAGIATAAAAVNAVPIAGQIASAALALAALFTKIFAGRKQRIRAQRRAYQNRELLAQKAYRDAINSFSPSPNMAPPAQAPNIPDQQGYGLFQQMQEEGKPLYTSGKGVSYGK